MNAKVIATKLLRIDIREAFLIAVLFCLSGLFRLAVLTIPLKLMHPFLGHYLQNSHVLSLPTENMLKKTEVIQRSIRRTAKITPWNTNCFVQALLAITLFKTFNIAYILHFGAAKNHNTMSAHAWTKVGDRVVTGKQGHSKFITVCTYIG